MATCNLSCLSLKPTIGGGLPSKANAKAPQKYNNILKLSNTKRSSFRCNSCLPTAFKTEPEPVFTYVKAFAPATISKFGPGPGNLACALDGLGHYVSVRVDPEINPGSFSISTIGIGGDRFRCQFGSLEPCNRECLFCSVRGAALHVTRMLGIKSVGLSLCLEEEKEEGLPFGSDLGSQAASAAATAFAINEIFGGKLSASELIRAGMDRYPEIMGKLSATTTTNIVPAIMGGFVHGHRPLINTIPLEFPKEKELFFILVIPEKLFDDDVDVEKLMMRTTVGDANYKLWDLKRNGSLGVLLVTSLMKGDFESFGSAMSSSSYEMMEALLAPSSLVHARFVAVKKAALEAGALGCTISGAGPVVVAFTDDEEEGKEIGSRMVEAFLNNGSGGFKASAMVRKVDRLGARVVYSSST